MQVKTIQKTLCGYPIQIEKNDEIDAFEDSSPALKILEIRWHFTPSVEDESRPIISEAAELEWFEGQLESIEDTKQDGLGYYSFRNNCLGYRQWDYPLTMLSSTTDLTVLSHCLSKILVPELPINLRIKYDEEMLECYELDKSIKSREN